MSDIDDDIDEASHSEPSEEVLPQSRSRRRVLSSVGIAVVIVALAVATVILAVDHRDAARDRADRSAFLQAARQAVVNLTTISSDHADADIARILDGSTGPFRDDFTARSKAFTSVVQQSHVSTTGTVTAAGIESASGDEAKVLVAATSKVTNAAGAQNEPRVWRLRLALQRTEGRILVSNVDFVA
ncbi:Mce-associated membrane protein [Nocardia transvalensis]|uniref:Mce-associated membrane protein n=1 Tax=Nocardia transvalensis TaxID=37333 RepID=A0A7W9ULQ9_9NOCA|nr:hypothetical protein [Nocardia transvalensis]MBB5917821.1 Mce-associated membrane protein [Nocardia transvalensis]